MALEDNQVLPAATGAGGMNPQLQAFINLLMGGGLHGFGGFGGQPFGGFGRFLMDNPGLMQGLGIIPHGAVPGPLPGASPVQDSTTAALGSPSAPPSQATDPASAPAAPTTPATLGEGSAAPSQVPGAGGLASLLSRAGAFSPNLMPPMLRKG
jgi:hypothetical protein